MNIVSRCEELASISWHNNQTLMEFEGASGELLHLARSQVIYKNLFIICI